jgi:glycosyltransferase involved in cell wall biosynthesis
MRSFSLRKNHIVISYNTCWYVYMFRLSLIRTLLQKGWRVTVLAPWDEYAGRVTETGAAHRHIDLDPKGTNPLRELAAIRRFVAAYRELSPDLVLQYTIKPDIYGSIAARIRGIPVINNVTGLGLMFSGGLKEAVVRALYKLALSKAEMTLFQNPDDHSLFLKLGIVKPERTALLPGSGVDSTRYAPQPRGDGPFTFLLAARLLRAKGVEEYIAAARHVKSLHGNTRFLLAGSHDPGDVEYVDPELLASACKENVVERHGHVDDIRPLIACADCVVLPSYYREGVPRSLLEAASMGKPLIAANSVGTREPVRDGVNGFLCRPRDADDLAEKMEAMMAMSAEQRCAMGDASRTYMIQRFDERIVIQTYLDAIERLVGLPGWQPSESRP